MATKLLTLVVLAATCALSLAGSSFYTSAGAVKNLDPKSFQKEVIEGKGVWLVEFYAPWCGHCKSLAPEWKKAAKALDGIVNVAAVDCDEHKSLAGQFGVQGFPTIKIFGDNKRAPVDYQGERSAKAIVDAGVREASKLAKARLSGKAEKTKTEKKPKAEKAKAKPSSSSSSDVVTLTDDTFDELVLNSGDVWLVEFLCAVAASELRGSVKLGALDATAHEAKAAEYGIKGFPTIKVFGPNAASASDATDYQGPRQASGITAYALQKLETLGGGMKLPEVTSEKVLLDHCAGKAICVLALLPHIIDGGKAGREAYLAQVESAAKLVRGKPFRFAWVQGGNQAALEEAFGLTFGYPSVLAINLDKQRYSVMHAAFDSTSIASYLEGIFSGRQSTFPYETLPQIAKTTGWDGQDATLESFADDDDDDIMAELGLGKDEL
ncbi:hypothetical protein SPRG_06029 [Saprolegnia parasitica CBS 223.65]|uniref:protein disulfide-isomerase n=1 Tax=Saprolegnia parasitica (strain CBS 223.65) TaxID=695850 RepID=A0A067CFE8_SAPPC|nr:hypothetical protein SPRG_06029 [Saprolegnia parasitica CBS 223.65]KDO29489.1 hypothetical protein SPRG_06029 [Saprolegnia parasitica CBS 223.65]|eukprot:XP_012199985.1 hypothetical protein SPRG_06029 [Saprolegnia parasitica CBS 223.65]